MTARERYPGRVRRAWRELHEAQEARRRVDYAAAEHRVADARQNLFLALSGSWPLPPEVLEAMRRLDEFNEDHPGPLPPDLEERNLELQRQIADAECAAGIHSFCSHRGEREQQARAATPPDDEDPVTGSWFDARRAQVWGVIQPDGTVQAKGFVGDDTADDDQAVYPAGVIAYYSPESGWTNAATGHPASDGPPPPVMPPKPPPDLADLRRGRWFDDNPITTTTTSAGGAAVSSIGEVRAGIMAANESANEGLGAVQHAHASIEQAQGMLMRATEGSGQADVSDANGLLAQAVNSLDEVQQQVAAAISAAEQVAARL